MRLVLTPQKLADVDSYNVVADLKGNELPDQVVIVSGIQIEVPAGSDRSAVNRQIIRTTQFRTAKRLYRSRFDRF